MGPGWSNACAAGFCDQADRHCQMACIPTDQRFQYHNLRHTQYHMVASVSQPGIAIPWQLAKLACRLLCSVIETYEAIAITTIGQSMCAVEAGKHNPKGRRATGPLHSTVLLPFYCCVWCTRHHCVTIGHINHHPLCFNNFMKNQLKPICRVAARQCAHLV